eukprot:CAMPEP_0174365124 /NCGR_PEP_ID=MMETSP0811_2-20130205/75994_1 /TAXON_ID=73025 ORGANISM="Eutreptiella gymnastica-like, Strain CCMP1594" /NCGR_SAMPLE_ID=MMETSP0811_2 /ASSEMBLY_ACC=CAM_ASM_000667 /LENGTH=82 /DNA_ID=CAMNT_0015505479 /DNA_START=34 /DNA_END=278 /DNA_ORIENTATION=+
MSMSNDRISVVDRIKEMPTVPMQYLPLQRLWKQPHAELWRCVDKSSKEQCAIKLYLPDAQAEGSDLEGSLIDGEKEGNIMKT